MEVERIKVKVGQPGLERRCSLRGLVACGEGHKLVEVVAVGADRAYKGESLWVSCCRLDRRDGADEMDQHSCLASSPSHSRVSSTEWLRNGCLSHIPLRAHSTFRRGYCRISARRTITSCSVS